LNLTNGSLKIKKQSIKSISFVLGNIFNGRDTAIIYWTEIFLCATFGVVVLIDFIVNVES